MAKGNASPQGNNWQNSAGTMGQSSGQRGGSFGMNNPSSGNFQGGISKPMMPNFDGGMVNRMNNQTAGMAQQQTGYNNLMMGNNNPYSRGQSGLMSNIDAMRGSGEAGGYGGGMPFQPQQQNNDMSGLMALLGQYNQGQSGSVPQGMGQGIHGRTDNNWRGGQASSGMFPNARF